MKKLILNIIFVLLLSSCSKKTEVIKVPYVEPLPYPRSTKIRLIEYDGKCYTKSSVLKLIQVCKKYKNQIKYYYKATTAVKKRYKELYENSKKEN